MKLFLTSRKPKLSDTVIVVSGLPRSGTSMMMNMLASGGLELLTDHVRTADEDNPKGYYEFERVKQLEFGDIDWVRDARGKVVKVISDLLEYLPSQYAYKVVFMERHIHEVLASQKQMIIRRGEDPAKVRDDQIALLFEKHVAKVKDWLASQANIQVLYVSYNDILTNPQPQVEKVNHFLGGSLDTIKMGSIADRVLYRQRSESK